MSETPKRRLAAILSADVVGYSRLMGEDETATLAALRQLRSEQFEPSVADMGGTVIKRMGDGWLVEFASVVDAVACALAVQEKLSVQSDIRLRIGIHIGDVVLEDEDIYGDGVNIAARLQEIAEPGGITLSDFTYHSLDNRGPAPFIDGGEQRLKNIARPLRVWCFGGSENATAVSTKPVEKLNRLQELLARIRPQSIAVHAFDDQSRKKDFGYFCDGLSDGLITELSKINSFNISKHRNDSPQAAVVADYLVEGSVQVMGPQIRINVQLSHAANRETIWADRFGGSIEDLFEVQDEVCEKLPPRSRPGWLPVKCPITAAILPTTRRPTVCTSWYRG